jgi:hypothetical protein
MTIGSGGAGLLGNCSYFDGSDDWVQLSPVFAGAATTFSINCFYKGTDTTNMYFGQGSSSNNALRLLLDHNGGMLKLNAAGDITYTISTDINNSWHQVFCNSGKIGVDGAQVAIGSNSLTSGTYDNAGIGGFNRSGTVPYNATQGYMQHISCYNVNLPDAWFGEEYAQISNNSGFWGTWTWQNGGI